MTTKIQQWGNSLAVRIPKSITVETELHKGTVVEVSEEGGKIILTPVSEKKITLGDLLSRVTKANIHGEAGTGKRVGRETW
jgi:antitoxin MazE